MDEVKKSILEQLKKRFLGADKTEKLALLLEIIQLYKGTAKKSVMNYCQTGIELSKKYNDYSYIHIFFSTLAEEYYNMEEYRNALINWNNALNYINPEQNYSFYSKTLLNIGSVYEKTFDYENAINYYKKALKIYEKSKNNYGIALCYYYIAEIYLVKNNPPEAIEMLFNAEKIGLDPENNEEHILRGNIAKMLGDIYQKMNDYQNALNFYFNALEIYNRTNHPEGIINIMNKIGALYINLEHYDEAFVFLSEGYEHAKSKNKPELKLDFLLNLAKLNHKIKKDENAYNYLEEAYKLRDNILHQRLSKKIEDITIKHEIEQKERELLLFKKKNMELEEAFKTIQEKNKELKVAYKTMEKLALHDTLTTLANRRFMMEKIEDEITRSKRSKKKFSFLLLDIDHFKRFNDTYGHDCGDYVLKELARILIENTREQDTPSRWGGEEFLILLPETDLDGAAIVAEKIRETVENHTAIFNETIIKITVTIGVATCDPGEENIDECIKRADDALYNGKESGRNKVFIAR